MTATSTVPESAAAAAAPEFAIVDLVDIKAHPDNPRKDVGDVKELAASILEHGILEPVVLAPPHTGMSARSMGKAKWLLVAGHRRVAAAKVAKVTQVPAIIRRDLTTRAAQLEPMLIENLHRSDLTPVEEGAAYQLMLDIDGLTQATLAARVGQPVTRIRERLRLTKLPEVVQDRLQTHQITIGDALKLAEFDDDPKTQKSLTAKAGTSNFEYALADARRAKQEAAELAKALALLPEGYVHEKKPDTAIRIADGNGLNGVCVGRNNTVGMPWMNEPNKRAQWALKHHKCPGALAWKEKRYSGSIELVFGCADRSLHPKPKVTKTEAELEQAATEKAAAKERADAFAAAASSRRGFLRSLVTGEDGARVSVAVAAEQLRRQIIGSTGLADSSYYGRSAVEAVDVLAQLLGLTVQEASKDQDRDEHRYALVAQITKALNGIDDLPTLILLLQAQRFGNLEAALSNPRQTRWDIERSHGWIGAVTAYGYEWSDFERETFVWDDKDPSTGAERHHTVDGWTTNAVDVADVCGDCGTSGVEIDDEFRCASCGEWDGSAAPEEVAQP